MRFKFFLTFYVNLVFRRLSFCVWFMILSSLVAYFLDLNSKFWIYYFFYFMFNRFKPPNNPLKPQARTRGNRSSFSGQLGLTFWLCGLDRVTTLSPNPPIPAHYPPLTALLGDLFGYFILGKTLLGDFPNLGLQSHK